MLYKVLIEDVEVVSHEFEIDANSRDEAVDMILSKEDELDYSNGEVSTTRNIEAHLA